MKIENSFEIQKEEDSPYRAVEPVSSKKIDLEKL